MEQPEGFKLSDNPDFVYKLKKYLYGLKKSSRAWYHKLDTYLKDKGFKRGIIENNMYIKTGHFFLVCKLLRGLKGCSFLKKNI